MENYFHMDHTLKEDLSYKISKFANLITKVRTENHATSSCVFYRHYSRPVGVVVQRRSLQERFCGFSVMY